MLITKRRLVLAGWVSVTSAVVSLPSIGLSLFLGTMGGIEVIVARVMLYLVSLGLFIYQFLSLKKLLNSQFQFHSVDVFILALIWTYIASGLSVGASLFPPEDQVPRQLLEVYIPLTCGILMGILYMLFGWKMLSLSDDLYGLLKPFCYATIALGLCSIIILYPAVILLGMISDVILAMIFFRAAEWFLLYSG